MELTEAQWQTAIRHTTAANFPGPGINTVGTIAKITPLGRPKQVTFTVDDGWGTKRFRVVVALADVELCRRKSVDTKQD